MVPFAGYEMPVQYATGVLREHLHTRASAGLFDVSHMGQIALRARSGAVEDAATQRWSGWCRRTWSPSRPDGSAMRSSRTRAAAFSTI